MSDRNIFSDCISDKDEEGSIECFFLKSNPYEKSRLGDTLHGWLMDHFRKEGRADAMLIGSATIQINGGPYNMHFAYLGNPARFVTLEFETYARADEFVKEYIAENSIKPKRAINYNLEEMN